jgi:hypothetical protein
MAEDERARDLETRFGHPGEKWEALKERVQSTALSQFSQIENEWLDLMWTLDQYRIANVPPRGMGKATTPPARRLGAIYRGKGNWFAETLALLLQNRTAQRIAPRQRVEGFSQYHQVDLAWPARAEDVRVCAETKVTGAPEYTNERGERTPARASRDDFSNRRKELKFAATDLKLYRRQQETKIDHWGVWRESAPPKTYVLWAARVKPGADRLERMIEEVQGLVNTYLDGGGIFPWQEREDRSGYEALAFPLGARVAGLDDVLHRIASEINALAGPDRTPPPPETPPERAIEPEALPPDEDE